MLLSEKEYLHVLNMMRGETEPDPVFTGFREFMRRTFKCELYDYIVDKIDDERGRLRYIVWDEETDESFFTRSETYYGRDSKKELMIKEAFSLLCRQENMHSDFHDPASYYALPETIKDELQKDIQKKVEKQISEYLNSLPIKKHAFFFESVHIFYKTDADIVLHQKDGLSAEIEKTIYQIKKPFDEFGALDDAGVVFSSIQTLNEKYDGNMFYYFR